MAHHPAAPDRAPGPVEEGTRLSALRGTARLHRQREGDDRVKNSSRRFAVVGVLSRQGEQGL